MTGYRRNALIVAAIAALLILALVGWIVNGIHRTSEY
jgi:hypothetical protein